MLPTNPGHLGARMRAMVLPAIIDKSVLRTYHMLAASAFAAVVIVGLAGVLMSVMI